MKKTIYLLLCFVTVIFIGCNTSSNQSENETSSGSSSIEQSSSNLSKEGIYIGWQNVDSDIYQDSDGSMSFHILSEKPLNIEDIKIEIPIEIEYEVRISDDRGDDFRTTDYLWELETGTQALWGVFTYEYYQCYRGIDWEKLRELREAWVKLSNDKEATWDEKNAAQEAYFSYEDQYKEDYQKITKEDLPIVYFYQVSLWFKEDITKEESFQNITVTIDDKKYEHTIGEIRLHPETLSEQFQKMFGDSAEGLRNEIRIVVGGLDTNPGGDGKMINREMFCFQAKEDITLEKLYLYESDIKPIGAFVTMSDKPLGYMREDNSIPSSNIGTMELYWDLKTPIVVAKGSYVKMDFIFEDSRSTQLEYGARMYPVMEYTIGEKTYLAFNEISLDRHTALGGYWLQYMMGMHELDMTPYFDYYKLTFEDWRDDLPQ